MTKPLTGEAKVTLERIGPNSTYSLSNTARGLTVISNPLIPAPVRPPITASSQPPSGGGGSVTAAEDHYHFTQMLANGGELAGKRILSPETVKLMSSNHLAPSLLTGQFGIDQSVMRPGLAMVSM